MLWLFLSDWMSGQGYAEIATAKDQDLKTNRSCAIIRLSFPLDLLVYFEFWSLADFVVAFSHSSIKLAWTASWPLATNHHDHSSSLLSESDISACSI